MRVLFRADCGPEIGLGHVMRCLALASALRQTGAEVAFLGRGYGSAMRRKVRERGCAFIPLTRDADDVQATRRHARGLGADAVVVDLYGIDEAYLRALRNEGIILVALDDHNLMPFPAHLVVNPNRFALDMQYRSSTGDTQFLLGPSYFLLREEFVKAREIPRRLAPQAQRLLISMGGSDPAGLTEKVIRAVAPLGMETVAIRGAVAVGDAAARQNVRVVRDPPDMARWMLWADLAVASGGGTIYELAATGTPGIILAQSPDQARNAAAMQAEGTLISLGLGTDVPEVAIAAAVQSLAGDLPLREAMSRRGREVVDGKGAQRVAEAIRALCLARHNRDTYGV